MSETIWHDVECGGYEADLPLWEELARATSGPIVELGCGTGRVTIHLGDRHEERIVVGLDRDAELLASLWERSRGGSASAELVDVRGFDIPGEFGLALAPMQLIQLLAGRSDRISCLDSVASHLAPSGIAAFAIVEDPPLPMPDGGAPPFPDVSQIEGWVYSSLPLESLVESGSIVLRRLRQTVSPEGELNEELNTIELQLLYAEALEVGLRAAGRRTIPATDAHVGSTVVVLEKPS